MSQTQMQITPFEVLSVQALNQRNIIALQQNLTCRCQLTFPLLYLKLDILT
jgi:hypothetical protein